MIKPSYDLSTLKTNHQIILFVRDKILEPMNLRIRLYPSFVKQANRCKNRDELIVLVHKLTKKAANLAREIGITKKVISPKRLDETEATLPKPATEPFSKVENTESTTITRERESIPITSTIIVQKNGYPKKEEKNNLEPSLSVWNHIQAYLKYPDEKKDDLGFFKRLENYSKRALVIINVIDTYQVFCVGEAWRKANEITGVNIRSQTTIGDLLNDLAGDGFLELEILETNRKIETSLYSIKGYKEKFPERYNIKKLRHSNDTTKKQLSKKMDIQEIEEKSTKISMAQKKGYAKAREIEQEELEKTATLRRTQREAEAEPQPKKLFTKPFSETETQDQLMINLISKMKPEQVQHDIKSNPRFKAEYDRLKGEGLL